MLFINFWNTSDSGLPLKVGEFGEIGMFIFHLGALAILCCLTCSRGCEKTDLLGFSWCWRKIIMFHFVSLFYFVCLFVFLSCCCLLTWNCENLIRRAVLQRVYNAFLSDSMVTWGILFWTQYNTILYIQFYTILAI